MTEVQVVAEDAAAVEVAEMPQASEVGVTEQVQPPAEIILEQTAPAP